MCNVFESAQNRPPPPLPWSMEKSSSMKPVPGTKEVGDLCFREYLLCITCNMKATYMHDLT